MAGNQHLGNAKTQKKDEFYTQLSDIEKELRHYSDVFRGKTVFCNCDDPEYSNFWKYFELNFEELGLKRLISTHYETEKPSYKLELMEDVNGDGKITGLDILKTPLRQNGDFRSPECIEILKEADIVVTNPPFSLFREYVAQLMEYKKNFIIIGNQNAFTYRETFLLIKENKIWVGYNSGNMAFKVPEYYEPHKTRYWVDETGQKWRSMGNVTWFTNIDIKKRHENLILFRNYSSELYKLYDNYEAININKLADIPVDYYGVMGVPITFIDKYNPSQFEIVGLIAGNIKGLAGIPTSTGKDGPYIDGKLKYGRVLIKRKESPE